VEANSATNRPILMLLPLPVIIDDGYADNWPSAIKRATGYLMIGCGAISDNQGRVTPAFLCVQILGFKGGFYPTAYYVLIKK